MDLQFRCRSQLSTQALGILRRPGENSARHRSTRSRRHTASAGELVTILRSTGTLCQHGSDDTSGRFCLISSCPQAVLFVERSFQNSGEQLKSYRYILISSLCSSKLLVRLKVKGMPSQTAATAPLLTTPPPDLRYDPAKQCIVLLCDDFSIVQVARLRAAAVNLQLASQSEPASISDLIRIER